MSTLRSASPAHNTTHLMAVAFGLVVCVAAAWAHEEHAEHAERPFTAREQHRPTPLPDRVVLTWSADPTTSIDVSWRTDTTVDESVAEFARADRLQGNLRDRVRHAMRVDGAHEKFTSDLGACRMHSVRLENLDPATMYAYRVGDGEEHWSEWFQFRTASAADDPFTFVYFGDAQNSVRSLWSRVIREANQHAPRAAFMLHAGDLINNDERDAEWGEWFGAGGWLNGMIPVIATPGNHEYDDDRISKHWRPQFAFPLNGPPGLEESVYWIDYQGARIISLNSNERIDEQCDWLRSVLSDSRRPRWTIVTFHHPIYSSSRDRDNPELRAAWRPILEEHGVDLVLQGHDHSYARSGLGGPTNVAEGVRHASGNTVFVVSVSGPKMYASQERWKFARQASGVQLFQVIRVSPQQIRYEARLATGELYDTFTLEKATDGKTTMIEQDPPSAEIRK